MDQALALAERGRGQTSPNPMVGALVVSDDGVVAGTGYHRRAGEAHAEVLALGEAAGLARGATLYCTLEPCSHHGRTGPCAERILASGIRRVVVALVDPNPLVGGSGIAYLRERHVDVDVGTRRRPAARLNEAFVTWITKGRPFVVMKIATSRDGKITRRPGERTPLTSDLANEAIHRMRAEVDAIAVGSNTVLVDDPLLTVRGTDRDRPLMRVVLDRRLRTPVGARLLQTLPHGPVVILASAGSVTRRGSAASALRVAGARLEVLPDDDVSLASALRRLAELDITSVLLEGGTTIHQAAWDARVVDRVQRFVAPVYLGPEGVPWLDLSIGDLSDRQVRSYGPDILAEGYVQRVD